MKKKKREKRRQKKKSVLLHLAFQEHLVGSLYQQIFVFLFFLPVTSCYNNFDSVVYSLDILIQSFNLVEGEIWCGRHFESYMQCWVFF